MTKEEVIASFDPNTAGQAGKIFGLPFAPEHASLIIIPVPWEVTVSYKTGAARGPEAILAASSQVDLFVKDLPDAWQLGICMLPVPEALQGESMRARELAHRHILRIEEGEDFDPQDPVLLKVNEASESLNIYVKTTAQRYLKEGKMVVLLGGDHSTPLGFLRALSEQHDRFGILHLDAHADLRKAYEGFTYSHASIMYNALKLPEISRIIQVGIRDLCEEEMAIIQKSMGRVVTFFDNDIKGDMFQGKTWDAICDDIINELPETIYISFDIDALDPKLCPNTGTPVPGGFEFEQALYLIKKVVRAGKKIIGIDLNEVAPGEEGEWDANVGARVLYALCNWMAVSRGKLKESRQS